MSASWLERALAAGGVVTPQRLAMEPEVTPIGHGTTSDVVRLRASYNSGHVTAPTSVICKIGQQQGESGPFTRELRAYQLFGPDPAFRTPRFYFGGIDESGLSNILLEDLSASAHAGDQIAGCSIAEAEAVVRELALFHRGFWNNPAIASLDWLSNPQRLLPAFQRGTEVLRQWLGQRIPAGDFDIITGFRERAERWLDMASPHVTLVHNDPRVDNILFEDRDGQTRACLIDWQSLGRGDPQSDVAYFLSGSLTPEDRRRCERDLVAAHAALIAETDSGYTTELALESYRRNIGSGLWMTAIAAAHVKQTDHNALLLETLVSRNTAAIRDWDGLSAIA